MKVGFYILTTLGYEYLLTIQVNPILMLADKKFNNIQKKKYLNFEDFEFEGSKPFKDFTFLGIPMDLKPGI